MPLVMLTLSATWSWRPSAVFTVPVREDMAIPGRHLEQGGGQRGEGVTTFGRLGGATASVTVRTRHACSRCRRARTADTARRSRSAKKLITPRQ